MLQENRKDKLTQWCSGWNCILINPERDPGQDNNKCAGNVGLNSEITHSPAQVKEDRHDYIVSCKTKAEQDRIIC